MFVVMRALFVGALALLALIPVGVVLAAIGLPVMIVLCVLALPLVIVLAVVGLPLFIVGVAGIALLGATFGVLMAFLSLGVVVLKVAFVVLVPLLILAWLLRRVFRPADEEGYVR